MSPELELYPQRVSPPKVGSMDDYSTCEISDALVKLGSPHGGCLVDIHCISPGPYSDLRIEGPAYTVKMVPFDDKVSPKPSVHFVDGAKEGHVIVISAPKHVGSAVWGGLMSLGAKTRGAKGVVISGRCRDVAEHREAQFPVFARGTSTLGQKPFTRPSELDVPIVIHPDSIYSNDGEQWPGVQVRPGDWVVADADGVVVIPLEQMERVKEICSVSRKVDASCKRDLLAGKGVAETFKLHRGDRKSVV